MSRVGDQQVLAPILKKVRQFAVSEDVISGKAVTMILALLHVGAIHAWACCRLAMMLPWVSIAPLATPVVPPGVLQVGEVVVGDRAGERMGAPAG